MSKTRTLEIPGHQVLRFLGNGAGSTLWVIREQSDGETLALKRVVRREAEDQRFIDQALNEYEVGRQLDHPAVRRIFRLRKRKRWLSLNEVQLIMEYCHGSTLQESRPEEIAEVLRIFLHVADAVAYVNSRGFVHADMKPNNIIVAPDGTVKIIDFGQSCPLGTAKRRVQGTPDFIAPEQVKRLPLDSRTDVFNFGASLYWTLTGKPVPTVLPRKGSGGTIQASAGRLTPPEDHNPEVPHALSRLVLDCIQPNPARRPESMADVLSRLKLIAHAHQRKLALSEGTAW